MLSLEQGEALVKLARRSIEYGCASGRLYSEAAPSKDFSIKRGVFVTLSGFPSKELRGCIGFPLPEKELWQSIIEAAYSAAFHDPRFGELKSQELENIVVEVSVLTEPKEIKAPKPEEYLEKIMIGRDGLILEHGARKGLLLPQVPIEWNWNVQAFLENCCEKAFLHKDAWKEKETKISTFQAQIFKELKPHGTIIEEKFKQGNIK